MPTITTQLPAIPQGHITDSPEWRRYLAAVDKIIRQLVAAS